MSLIIPSENSRRKVLITGCSRGLGLILVRRFLNSGWFVIAHVRNRVQEKELLNDLSHYKSNLWIISGDMISESEMSILITNLKNHLNSLDVLINNAGVFSHEDDTNISNFSITFFKECFSVNLLTPIILIEMLYPLLLKSDLGIVLNLLSDLVEPSTMDGFFPMYRTTKAGLTALTLNENKNTSKVKIVGIDPGWMRTDMGGDAAPDDPDLVAAGILELLETPENIRSGAIYKGSEARRYWGMQDG